MNAVTASHEHLLVRRGEHSRNVHGTADGRLDSGFAGCARGPSGAAKGRTSILRRGSGRVRSLTNPRMRSPGRQRKKRARSKCAAVAFWFRAGTEFRPCQFPQFIDEAAIGGVTCDPQLAGWGALTSLSAPVLVAARGNLVGDTVTLLPAQNEAADIATALDFLCEQTRRPDLVSNVLPRRQSGGRYL